MQIVVLRGTNPTGTSILVRAIYTHIPSASLPPSSSCPMDLDLPSSSNPSSDQAAAAAGGAGAPTAAVPELSMVVATGPFTLTDDCSYEPLRDLLKALQRCPPQVLVLVGPFVDEEHPAVSGGQLQLTYQQLFQQQVWSIYPEQQVCKIRHMLTQKKVALCI